MQTLIALSAAPTVNVWLANSRHSRILHAFDRACNLINQRGEVLSIVTAQIGNGPFNLVIEEDVLFSDHINAEDSISIRTNQLELGDLTINTENAQLWFPRPDWETLYAKRDVILSQVMSLREWRSPARSNPLATTLSITNYQPPNSNSLISALANADLPNCIVSAKHLAGLGQGLTPAGDDFILGAVLAAWIIHPPDVAKVLAEGITNTAAPLTTSLSASWLRSAGKGEAGILWHQFFDALISANPSRIQVMMGKILDVGETSGADALAGFMGTLESYTVEARN